MNLYLRELKVSLKPLFLWCIFVAISLVFMLSIYPSLARQSSNFDAIMESFPEEVIKALGLSTLNFGNLMEFFAYIMSFIIIVSAIYGMNLGINALSKEEEDKTAEFLITKPISRVRIVLYKLLSSLTDIILYNMFFLTVSFLILEIVKQRDYELLNLVYIVIGMFILQLVFMSIGIVLSVFINKNNVTSSVVLLTVFTFYSISLLSGMFDNKKWVKYFTPFKYFDSIKIVSDNTLDSMFIVISIIIILICIITTFVKYKNRDINI
jgi:ABC-2 type transport system permease protein